MQSLREGGRDCISPLSSCISFKQNVVLLCGVHCCALLTAAALSVSAARTATQTCAHVFYEKDNKTMTTDKKQTTDVQHD